MQKPYKFTHCLIKETESGTSRNVFDLTLSGYQANGYSLLTKIMCAGYMMVAITRRKISAM